jgi:hypothetical protein
MFAGTIHRRPVDDEGWALRRESYADGCTLGVYDPDPAGRLVGTVSSFPSQTLVPGGAVLRVAGIYRLGVGTAERVGPLGSAAPELECDVGALATAYLGDRAPSTLAAAGWWIVRNPDALPRADALFATDVVPWCGTDF